MNDVNSNDTTAEKDKILIALRELMSEMSAETSAISAKIDSLVQKSDAVAQNLDNITKIVCLLYPSADRQLIS